jgi:GT2 family glycosyltransferase
MNTIPPQFTEAHKRVSQHGKIGVVTVLYNSEIVLPEFLASLDGQTFRNFVVYCVDNASKDRSCAMCKERGAQYVVIENGSNEGVARGNNQGIQAALADGCEYVLLLNNDVAFENSLFADLLAGLAENGGDMVTPLIYYYEPRDLIWCAGGTFSLIYGKRGKHFGIGEHDRGQYAQDRKVDYSPTCCVLVHSSVFARIGMMDERYFVYWDDSDWMLRAKEQGITMWYLARPKLWHKVSSLTDGMYSDFTTRYGRRNNAYYHFKHLPIPAAAAYTVVYSSFFLASMLFPKRRHRARLSLRSWWEGIRMYRAAVAEQLARKEKRTQ